MREHFAGASVVVDMKTLTLCLLAVGCSHSHPTTTPIAAVAPGPTVTSTPTKQETVSQPVSPNVSVAGDLAKQCSLAIDHKDDAPKFDYNEFQLLPDDRAVLERVATCITTGPLKGRALRLIGRADPRGTEEYNLGLGTRRATMVGDYLTRLGVRKPLLAETTRGAIDAIGTDESGWRVDRRVDVELAN